MQSTVIEQKETTVKEGKEGKRKWLNRFLHFLMYGGWLLVVIFILAIVIIVSVLTK